MIETEQVDAQRRRALLGLPVVAGTHEEAPPRALFGGIGQRHEIGDMAVASEERAAAFVRIGLLAVRSDCLVDGGGDRQIVRLKGSRSFDSRSFGSRFLSHR
jgi:hypothetical protein